MRIGASRPLVTAFFFYVVVALVQTWPLPQHLSTRLTGVVDGDTGVYVWNTWVFRHELVDEQRSPFRTSMVLPLDGPTDLSLHNYTVFNDVVALPLLPVIGVVAAFNVVFLLNIALAGFGMFLLVRRLTHQHAEAWIAGLLFACGPFLVTRGDGHFSLAAAAPLPFFMYWLDRAWQSTRVRDAAAAGAMLAWGMFCDPYFAVYCVLLGSIYVADQLVLVRFQHPPAGRRRARVAVDVAIAAIVCAVMAVHVLGGGQVAVGGLSVTMRSLYTPVLLLTILVLVRCGLVLGPRLSLKWPPRPDRIGWMLLAAGVSSVVLLWPVLVAVIVRAAEGRMPAVPVFWRSSAPGVDLAAFFVPNPNHPLAPSQLAAWEDGLPGRYIEAVASLSWVGFGVIAYAWRRGFRPNRLWLAITLGFLSIALGPFLHVGGVQTYIPTPWALLRYVPIIGQARMPTRFAVVVLMGFSVIVGMALTAIGRRDPSRRRIWLWGVGVALAFELLPAPRTLFPADIPAIYQTVAADPRRVRLLELPFGIRDGLTSDGNFSPASEYYQTLHGKALIGGYLSRVSADSKRFHRGVPLLSALMDLSEGRPLTAGERRLALSSGRAFPLRTHLGYVVIDTTRASPELRQFGIEALHLQLVAAADGRELYTPAAVLP
jgi:hypothetical protein